MPDLTPRQLALLRILADADGPQAASFVAACYMIAHSREAFRRDNARQDLEGLCASAHVISHTSAGGAVLWEIAPAGRKALNRAKKNS